jgi:hypothetical protein
MELRWNDVDDLDSLKYHKRESQQQNYQHGRSHCPLPES